MVLSVEPQATRGQATKVWMAHFSARESPRTSFRSTRWQGNGLGTMRLRWRSGLNGHKAELVAREVDDWSCAPSGDLPERFPGVPVPQTQHFVVQRTSTKGI